MKKILLFVLMLSLMMETFLVSSAFAEEPQILDIKEYLFELSDDMSDEEYMSTVEKNFRIIKEMKPLFTEDSFKAFNKTHKTGSRKDYEGCNKGIDLLVQTTSVADGIWYLWDADNMPMKDGEVLTVEQIDAESSLDYGEFIPYLIKYLQDDPGSAKGNIILCSGGGYESRANAAEGYPTAKIFKELGYNVFLLQRRIAPYCPEDIWMDMQRAIKMVRYFAEKENYGGQDMIAAAGWSGGGATLMGAIDYCYGTLTPADEFDPDYVPDEIDAVNSDLDVAMPIYGVWGTAVDDIDNNQNLPAFYICHGEADDTVPPEGSQMLYDKLLGLGIPAQLFMVPEAIHGFGPGGGSKGGVGSEKWPYEADEFMQEHRGYSAK